MRVSMRIAGRLVLWFIRCRHGSLCRSQSPATVGAPPFDTQNNRLNTSLFRRYYCRQGDTYTNAHCRPQQTVERVYEYPIDIVSEIRFGNMVAIGFCRDNGLATLLHANRT